MNQSFATVKQLVKMLHNLDQWLDAGVEFAKKKSFDAEILLAARLAPDQYALVRQVQAVCDTAKFAAARLTAKEAPAHPDTEKTIAELHTRINAVVTYLETFTEADFAGAEERHISLPWMEGKWVSGAEYLTAFVLPNFYFHAATAYAILRHNGVELGKRNFIGSMNMQEPAKAS